MQASSAMKEMDFENFILALGSEVLGQLAV
jgi:hypothetical protein